MEFDFFLWPVVLPLVILMFYAIFKKHELVRLSISVLGVGGCIVVLYWPLLTLELFKIFNYIVVKFFIFVFLPIIVIAIGAKVPVKDIIINSGIRKIGWKLSLVYCVVLLPVMLIVSILLFYFVGVPPQQGFVETGILYFFEAFSEEFFFRGILFLFLLKYADIRIVYIVSLMSFILIHPQHLTTLFLLSTGVQGVLTVEIVRRSHNLVGAWLLHGTNRVFILLILSVIFG